MPFRKKQDVYCLFSECFPRILVCNMWVSTQKNLLLGSNMFKAFSIKWFLSQIGPWSFQIHCFGSSDFYGFLGMIFDGSPPKKKTWNHQIFRIFLLDLKWLRLKLFLGGRRLCHFEEMILKKAARGWLDIDLLWGPMTWLTGQRLNRLMGSFLEIPCHRRWIMWIIEVYYVLFVLFVEPAEVGCFMLIFLVPDGVFSHHNQELLGFFRILTGFDRSKATCSSFLAVSCLFWRACFCQHHGFTAPCFHF